MKTLVIIPTYNERPTIESLLTELVAGPGEAPDVLVVDDGSPDGTGAVVTDVTARHDNVHILQRGSKRGFASAYLEGFAWALGRGYDAVVEMDGDLSHDPASVATIVAELNRADLVIGSRYIPGGAVEHWGVLRRFLSRAGNLYARAWLAFPVRDSTSGFRAYRSTALAAQNLRSIRSDGYAFQIEMTHRVFARGGRIKEVPITFSERRFGKSKLSRRIVFEALLSVPVWGIRHRLHTRRRNK